ncbi:hypothetical protein GJ744_000484 [Endocarpon pusillum]|uniref:Uncharacterized protein n=1 Tax=Endocarpon pusillum TaxID=364733 RepID=A0A8H7ABE3_9EURO|nr:hypothetical protein GJ744_000484 [Endocarpon pusillum]
MQSVSRLRLTVAHKQGDLAGRGRLHDFQEKSFSLPIPPYFQLPNTLYRKPPSKRPTIMPTVTFHPSTNPPVEPTHIHIIPGTEIHLRNSKTWIPVQIFDLITQHLSHVQAHPTAPYKDLLHTLSFITSYPITGALISEIQNLLLYHHHHHRNNSRSSSSEDEKDEKQDDDDDDLWRPFDDMHAQWISLQRERVSAAQASSSRLRTEADPDNSLPGGPMLPPRQLMPAGLRAEMNAFALREAQTRARRMEEAAVRILLDADGNMEGVGAAGEMREARGG